MPEHIQPDTFDILGRDIAPPSQEGICLGGQGQSDGSTWRSPKLNQLLQVQLIGFRVSVLANEIYDVVLHLLIHIDVVDHLPGKHDLVRLYH